MVMTSDPWKNSCDTNSNNIDQFEDNFVGDALPDSAEYLARLEKKLARLKNSDKSSLLESLEETRRDCVVRLLTEDVNDCGAVSDPDIPTKWLKSYINPQQPLTVGELVELVKADHLEQATLEATRGSKVLCIVTGGSQGIGRCIALEISKILAPGSKIILIARSKTGMEETQNQIISHSQNIAVKNYQFDLSKPEYNEYSKVFEENKGDFERVVLVHNAGSEGNGTFVKDMKNVEDWEYQMSLNLYSVSIMTSSFLKVFEEMRKTIVNVTSLAAVQPFKSMGYYCVHKAAREMYFRTLAEENPELDILSYSPGPVDTEMVTRLIDKVSDLEVKGMFTSLKNDSKLVQAPDTVQKLINSLETSEYKSGGRIDYFDR